MEINCLPPIHDESVFTGNITYFGDSPNAPTISHPYHERRQENQGSRQWCVIYSFFENLENKIFSETGQWWHVPFDEHVRVWGLMVDAGLANDSTGAFLNAPHKVLNQKNGGKPIKLINKVSEKSILVSLTDYFYVLDVEDSPEEAIIKLKKEVHFGGGFTTGLNSKSKGLDYYGAWLDPYIIEKKPENQIQRHIAHAITVTHYNDEKEPKLFSSSGTYGEGFADKGVVFGRWEDYKSYFSPLGFTIKIL